ncbi:MAG: FIST N-terminal domain-containing protein, partial [Pseudomonadota bacterium]
MKDHVRALPWREGADQVLAAAKVPADHPLPMEAIKAALGPGPFALVLLFASPSADFAALTAASGVAYPSAEIIACTTAGEIFDGYSDGTIVAI